MVTFENETICNKRFSKNLLCGNSQDHMRVALSR
jgi:hypothetical protein